MLYFCTFPWPFNNLVDTRYVVFKVDGFYCAARKDLGMGGWGLGNPYRVRILKSIRIIGPSLNVE